MKRRLAVMLGSGLLLALHAGCDRLPGKPNVKNRYRLPSEVVDFETLYGTHCAGCHGYNGKHGAARNLNDPLYLSFVGEERFKHIVSAGVPETMMPGFGLESGGSLNDKQIDALWSGARQWWARRDFIDPADVLPYAQPDDHPGDVQRGAKTFGKFCAHCHGDGSEVTDPNYLALVSDQALRTAVVCGRTDFGMPDYRRAIPGQEMTLQEIADVSAWLTSHRERHPVPLPPRQAAPNPSVPSDLDNTGDDS